MNHFNSILDDLVAFELLEVCIRSPSDERARQRVVHMDPHYIEFCCRRIRRNGQREVRLEVLLFQSMLLKAKESETTEDWWLNLCETAKQAMKSVKGHEVLL